MAVYRELTLCRRVRALRVQAGLSQVQVAERLGVSQAAYSRLEKGEVRLTLERLMVLAEVYGVEVGVLMQGV